uniref:Uncharacterized protein n=1 Tax=Tetranychus urticae TaxID=32264 RepID=T1KLC7_TETUR
MASNWIDYKCHWIVGYPFQLIKSVNESETWLDFKTSTVNREQSSGYQNNGILGKLVSPEINVNKMDSPSHCTLVITMKMVKFESGLFKIVRQSVTNREPETVLSSKPGNNYQSTVAPQHDWY